MFQDAAKADVTEATKASIEKEVVVPVGLPEEGIFDAVDLFLKKNPNHLELSERKLLEWGEKSGIWRQKGFSWKTSNDRPDLYFGLPGLDDQGALGLLHSVAPMQDRNIVLTEARANLIAEERKAAIAPYENFKKIALVTIGEPVAAYKEMVQDLLLTKKKEEAADTKKKEAEEAERKRKLDERQKKAQ